jgi:hypothetical protein
MREIKRYDEEMIRDFLHHLRAEVAMSLFQLTRNGEPPDRGLLARLVEYAGKYDVCGLLPTTEVDAAGVPADCVEDLWKDVKAARVREMEKALDALDALESVLVEVFRCLKQPHQALTRRVRLADVFAGRSAGNNGAKSSVA